MKNTLGDLNNHLFAQMERLGDEDITGDDLLEEIARSKSIASISTQIVANAALVLEAKKIQDSRFDIDEKMPKMLEG